MILQIFFLNLYIISSLRLHLETRFLRRDLNQGCHISCVMKPSLVALVGENDSDLPQYLTQFWAEWISWNLRVEIGQINWILRNIFRNSVKANESEIWKVNLNFFLRLLTINLTLFWRRVYFTWIHWDIEGRAIGLNFLSKFIQSQWKWN